MRALKRSVARHNMKKAGVTQMNKKKYGNESYFARKWRDYLKEV